MIVLDASVLIAYLDADDVHHARAEELLAAAALEDLGVNPLTLAEVLVGPTRTGQLATALEVLRELEVAELAFPQPSAARLARLRAATGLKMPDCCVLLTAEVEHASVATFDERLLAAARALGVSTTGLR